VPTMKEFTIRLDDRPGTLGKLCPALAGILCGVLFRGGSDVE
jgi:hypothetical protein